ncbi:MAG TPA: M56 family metallopeptidase [Chitinophagaceae bacterium]|nr:M56 family metallopeptidase [Chitinophagaceae bacterium]
MHTASIINILNSKAAQAFCWMLVHSLWQGLLFTIITGIVLLATKKSSAVLRYNIMCILLCLFLAGCMVTFVWQLSTATAGHVAEPVPEGIAAGGFLQGWVQNFTGYFSANAGLILIVWVVVFIARCVKMTAGLVYSQRVRHYKVYTPSAEWQQKLVALRMQLNIKKNVILRESGLVKIPVVIGHLKPVVFMPLGLLAGLPAGEVEAVLLHELAHIRRNDYFVNILQVVAENVFFFNPALLWMSSIIREEREHCCDDVAVAEIKNKKQFIQALVRFKEHALYAGNNLATAFPARKNHLLARVTRLINSNNKTLTGGEKIFFIASFIILAGLSVAVTSPKVTGKKAVSASTQTAAVAQPQPVAAVVPVVKAASHKIPAQQTTQVKNKAANKTTVIEFYQKVITDASGKLTVSNNAGKQQVNNKQPLTDREQAELDRQQAERDRLQADLDRKQADADRAQAVKNQAQAEEDHKQADRDRIQAEQDRKQAELDRQQAEKEKTQAGKNQQ